MLAKIDAANYKKQRFESWKMAFSVEKTKESISLHLGINPAGAHRSEISVSEIQMNRKP